jgi:Lrp/AsnC family leucine-responsive transcriptional regulator
LDYLVKDKKVGLVAKAVGDWDLIYTYFVKDIHEFSNEWDKFTDRFRSVIKNYNTHMVTKEYSYPRNYISGEKKDPKTVWERGGNVPEGKLDDTDLKVLKLLLEDARIPVKDIALKTGLGSMAIIYRFRQLAKKMIILGYRADLDFSKLGYEYYKVFLELDDTKFSKDIQAFCKASPFIVSVTKTISDNDDFEFDLEVANFNEMLGMMDSLKKQFPKAIRDYKYIKVLEMYKQVHLPL